MGIIRVMLAIVFMQITADAQIPLQRDFNIDRQPIWGPAGYDYVEYYYLPDIEVYYNVLRHRFYYYEQGRWISGTSLPSRYREFDFYNSYKVVINISSPYRHHKKYQMKYFSFRGRHDQTAIRDSRDERYFMHKDHPEHHNWIKKNSRDAGRKMDQGTMRKKK